METQRLYQLMPNKGTKTVTRPAQSPFSGNLTKIARLGGYLARAIDPPPGNTVMWRGLSRRTDIKLGAMLATPAYG